MTHYSFDPWSGLVRSLYRPPNPGEIFSVESLGEDISPYERQALGTVLTGDMNVHEEAWLKHSDGSSVEGRLLRDIACRHGWEERVRRPTQGSYLLDFGLDGSGNRGTDQGRAKHKRSRCCHRYTRFYD